MEQLEPKKDLAEEIVAHKQTTLSSLTTTFLELVMSFQVSQAIHVAAELNLADLLKDQPKTTEELAEYAASNPAALYRLLRVLAATGFLAEIAPHRFALTDLGQLLCATATGSLYNTARFQGSQRQWLTWQHFLHSIKTGESASQHAFGVDSWEYFAQHPQEARIFYDYMTELTNLLAPALAAGYDFKEAQIVADVGGGNGTLLATILKANPHLKGILFDLPHVTKNARQLLEEAGVAERCEIISGDMFSAWPFKADLYLISRVIHDWDDEHALTILKNCREVMEAESRVILVERLIGENKEAALLVLLSDLQMLVSTGGRERYLAEYQTLFKQAGLSFIRTSLLYPPFNFIEGVRA